MKKNRFTEFFKGKGYYVLLFVGVIAIAAVAIVGSRLTSEQSEEDENYVDLNEPDNNIAAGEDDNQLPDNNLASEGIVNHGQDNNSSDDVAANDVVGQDVADNDSLLEYDVYSEDEAQGIDLSQAETSDTEQTEEDAVEEPETIETSGKTVQADTATALESLSFQADKGLLWPVDGNVIMNYSMDHTIYHATLMQYKCNPAVIIEAEVGTEVKAAARGIVSNIEENEETGLTVTTSIGDGYNLVYGQLDNVDLKVGDKLNEGDIIGTVKEPTKYYSVEGSNLYFKVLENEQTVNPMLYLR